MRPFIILLTSCFLILTGSNHYSQTPGTYKKERKKVSRGWKKSNQSYNPYLDKKEKNKPSARMARQEKKELKKQKRRAKKQMRRSRKQVNK